jgi:hypothetical protein
MPVASGTRLRRVADTGLHRAHLAFAQVGSFQSGSRPAHDTSRFRPGESAATACVVSVEAVVACANGGV